MLGHRLLSRQLLCRRIHPRRCDADNISFINQYDIASPFRSLFTLAPSHPGFIFINAALSPWTRPHQTRLRRGHVFTLSSQHSPQSTMVLNLPRSSDSSLRRLTQRFSRTSHDGNITTEITCWVFLVGNERGDVDPSETRFRLSTCPRSPSTNIAQLPNIFGNYTTSSSQPRAYMPLSPPLWVLLPRTANQVGG